MARMLLFGRIIAWSSPPPRVSTSAIHMNKNAMARLIMVIDDTQEILDVCEEILTDAGYRVSLLAYSARNLDDIKRARPDVIICDHPPVNQRQGWQFLQRLKADQETAAIPLIICTTSTTLVRENEGWLRA